MPEETPPQSSIILYQTEDGRTCIQCRFEDDTIWLTQVQLADLFQVTVPTVNEHLKGIYTESELTPGATIRKFRIVRSEGVRPINSMIEFKQIIGRGTRLYDGKDYFTIYDFVKAHHHFSDPEWDGEPIEPEPKPEGKTIPPLPPLVDRVREEPVEYVKRKRIKVKLADGKARTIQHMMVTTFWHPDGTPMSAQQFLETLFGKLPEFFKSEAELRAIWSSPDTRTKLLLGLSDKGFGAAQMAEMQRIIDAENSDLFDVLAHVAYAMAPLTREERALRAKLEITSHFNSKQQAFLDFVLAQYVKVGVEELAQDKLSPLLKLRYHNAIADAVADLGQPEEIGRVFAGFQKYLYQPQIQRGL
jgi:type I restriction enzyme R subunit